MAIIVPGGESTRRQQQMAHDVMRAQEDARMASWDAMHRAPMRGIAVGAMGLADFSRGVAAPMGNVDAVAGRLPRNDPATLAGMAPQARQGREEPMEARRRTEPIGERKGVKEWYAPMEKMPRG